jgi:hypothetical protein
VTANPVITDIRWYVVVVGVLVAIVGTAQIPRWRTFLYVNQLAWVALALMNLATVTGNIEVLIHPNPGGLRTYLSAIAVTFELCAVSFAPARTVWRRWRLRREIRRTCKSRHPMNVLGQADHARPEPKESLVNRIRKAIVAPRAARIQL